MTQLNRMEIESGMCQQPEMKIKVAFVLYRLALISRSGGATSGKWPKGKGRSRSSSSAMKPSRRRKKWA